MRKSSAAAAAIWRCGSRARCSRRCATRRRRPPGIPRSPSSPRAAISISRRCSSAKMEKGFFTRELELALLDRRIDLVVHSLKDLPTAEPGAFESHDTCRAPRPPTGCWCATNSTRSATMACCHSRQARASALLRCDAAPCSGNSRRRRCPCRCAATCRRDCANSPKARASMPSCWPPPGSRVCSSICPRSR